MVLDEYQRKRNFSRTPEPGGAAEPATKDLPIFVIQKHHASHLHYDFRLEAEGVLKSWAVPKGPSLDPSVKRLAMMVEDHPYSYKDFAGVIPKGNYGAGTVEIWDNGRFSIPGAATKQEVEDRLMAGLAKGKVDFVLHGSKVQGLFTLVKTSRLEKNAWLLIKKKDESVSAEDVTVARSNAKPIVPMLATLVEQPFTKEGWIFEQKWDGYRAIAEVAAGEVRLYSRNGKSFLKDYPSVVEALRALPVPAILDGEIVSVNENGQVQFQLLQGSASGKGKHRYYVFDLLHLDGHDLTRLPLLERKSLLETLLKDNETLVYSAHSRDGVQLFEQAQAQGLEGIMAKRADSRYQAGVRSPDWLKIKTTKTQEAIICGYTQERGSRKHFGALVLGAYQNGELTYIGHTGTGLNEQQLGSLKRQLDKIVTKQSPFKVTPKTNSSVTWVKPELVCEIKFSEWTNDGRMRQPVFMRLRDDKRPEEVVREQPATQPPAMPRPPEPPTTSQRFTNLDKIYWPERNLTKGDLIAYYQEMAPYILPYLLDRPQSLNRFPNGIHGPHFFQKDMKTALPEWAETITLTSDDGETTRYLVCANVETLLYMANLGCIEMNPWNSRVESLDCPDYLVLDLDPEAIEFAAVVKTAQVTKQILDQAKTKAFIKTSGKTGLHIHIPLKGGYETEVAAQFSKLVATLVHQQIPDITSLKRSPKGRQGKVYVDFLQNSKGQTLAAPYSLRPTPEATVSTPLAWDEVTESLNPKNFTIATIGERVQQKGDLWQGLLQERADLLKGLERLQKLAA